MYAVFFSANTSSGAEKCPVYLELIQIRNASTDLIEQIKKFVIVIPMLLTYDLF